MTWRGSFPDDPDGPVLERVVGGDVESFGVLVERHQERLWRVCERLLGDADEARDATQEAFLKAFRGAASYRPKGKVYTWLYRIAVNHCLNRLRRRQVLRFLSFPRRGSDEEEEPSSWEPVDTGPDAERRLASGRQWRKIRVVVAGLPVGQRAVLVLAKFEGLSYREIAEVLDITVGAVESRLVRAMRRLSAVLSEDEA